jgi:hypothetical protein
MGDVTEQDELEELASGGSSCTLSTSRVKDFPQHSKWRLTFSCVSERLDALKLVAHKPCKGGRGEGEKGVAV